MAATGPECIFTSEAGGRGSAWCTCPVRRVKAFLEASTMNVPISCCLVLFERQSKQVAFIMKMGKGEKAGPIDQPQDS